MTQGFLLINKPTGVTSFYCIKKIRQFFERGTKIGHAGTLDSFATGLLIVAINRTATKQLDQFLTLDKQYIAQAKLGQLTDTLDFTGTLVSDKEPPHITEQQLDQTLLEFGDQYTQTPPIFSALKHEGRTLSGLARSQKLSKQELKKIAQEKQRIVHLYQLELREFTPPFFSVYAHVSHGTYIRVLMNDIAQKCGTVATTHALQRTAIGPFLVDAAHDLADLNSAKVVEQCLIPIETMLEKLKQYQLTR